MPTGVYERKPKTPKMTKAEKDAHNCMLSKKWSAANPDYGMNLKLEKAFNITLAQYRAWSEATGNVCHICSRPERIVDKRSGKVRKLAVDHDEQTGLVRGLLCSVCNRGIGMLQHDTEILKEALEYLNHFNTVTVPGVSSASD